MKPLFTIALLTVIGTALVSQVGKPHQEQGLDIQVPTHVQAEEALQSPTLATLASVSVQPATEPVKASGGSCSEWMTQAGIPHSKATDKLILNESGCRTNARNPSSGACGIPQALPCSKMKCPLDDSGAVCQLKWMDKYVKDRYTTWDNALATWYSRCGSKEGCWY